METKVFHAKKLYHWTGTLHHPSILILKNLMIIIDFFFLFNFHLLLSTGSLDLSSNASSDSESSLDTEDSRKSYQNFNRMLSDPGTEHDETQLQAYLRTVTQRSQFTQKHRCNTLPSSLEGLSGEESHDETMPSVLAAECRKFEASLKAMSSSMFYLTENEQRQASEYGQDYIDRVEDSSFHNTRISHHMAAKIPVLDDSLPPLRNQSTAQVSASTPREESSLKEHSRDLETNGFQSDKCKQGNARINKANDLCSSHEFSTNLQDNIASKSNFICDLCPEHKPSLGQYLCMNSDLDNKSYALMEDSVKGNKNKLTLFASIKESFLNFFEGKSSKMKKPKLEMPSCKSEDADVSDFAVREFPMSSCPNYRKEIISEDSEEVFLSNESPDTGVICLKDKASDFHGQQTPTKLSRPNGTQLKHSMSDISPSKLQALKRFDHMSTDSLKTRTQVIGMSRQHSHSLPTVNQFTEPVQVSYPPASVPSSPATRNEFFKNSTELSRFYHVFKDGELSKLISKQVPNVRIVSSTYDHANWCIVAEKCLTS